MDGVKIYMYQLSLVWAGKFHVRPMRPAFKGLASSFPPSEA